MIGEFYIEDYIWIIIGGLFVFFVIIGFIADKTGLAGKTFGKMPSAISNKKGQENKKDLPESIKKLIEEDIPYKQEPVVKNFTRENPIKTVEQETNIADNLYLSEDDFYKNLDKMQSTTPKEENSLYLNGDEEFESSSEKFSSAMMNKEESTPVKHSNKKDDLYQSIENVSLTTSQKNEENARRMDDIEKKESTNKLTAPKIEKADTKKEEDDWRF